MVGLSDYRDKFHKGTPGARWALWSKFIIERVPGDPYLTRWRIIHTPWFGILLHKIDGPDPDQHPHDHPWAFVSLVLKGGYVEQVTTRDQEWVLAYTTTRLNKWGIGSVHRTKRGVYHKIIRLMDKPTWTLVLTGPRRHDWGFLTELGHVPWKKYLGLEMSNQVGGPGPGSSDG